MVGVTWLEALSTHDVDRHNLLLWLDRAKLGVDLGEALNVGDLSLF